MFWPNYKSLISTLVCLRFWNHNIMIWILLSILYLAMHMHLMDYGALRSWSVWLIALLIFFLFFSFVLFNSQYTLNTFHILYFNLFATILLSFVVTCMIMQKNGAGLHTASSCYWNNDTDGSCTVRWENKTMYCIVSVFGLAI